MRRTIALLATAALLVLAAGCSIKASADKVAEPPETRVAVCNTVYSAYQKLMKPNHLSFADFVDQNAPTKTSTAAAATMSLSLLQGDAVKGLGPYRPAILYLTNRSLHWHKEFAKEYPMPKRTTKVTDSAKRLDRDVDSLCKPDKVVKPTTTR